MNSHIPFSNVFIEISGVCNAHCPYCLNGRNRRSTGSFMAPSLFDRALRRLEDLKWVKSETLFNLYNWGEPLLHPQLDQIIDKLNQAGYLYALSTNASFIPSKISFGKSIQSLIFSMPGFSQNSYDLIHGFDFREIVTNISRLARLARQQNKRCRVSIHYHVYQFNLSEIEEARRFAGRENIEFRLDYAILNNWWDLWAYLENKLPYAQLKSISQNLFSHALRDLQPPPAGYKCPQYDLLVLDEDLNILLCCQVPRDISFMTGNLFDKNAQDYLNNRIKHEICAKCIHNGVAPYLNTALTFPDLTRQTGGGCLSGWWRLFGKMANKVDKLCFGESKR